MKILIGGSPCTHWSIAQKNNRETEPEGLGWELFKNYLIAKEKFQPDFFLYENNKSAAQPIKDQIAKELGVELQYINSALVSAQNRQRFYAHNIPGVPQPEDRGILLRDILESGVDLSQNEKSYCLTASYDGAVGWNTLERKQRTMVAEPVCVAQRGVYESTGNRSVKVEGDKIVQIYEAREDRKTNTLTTVQKDNLVAEPVRIGDLPNSQGEISGSQATRIYSIDGKSVNLVANGGGQGAKTGLYAVPVDTPAVLRYERTETAKKLRKSYEAGEIKHGYHEFHELHPREDGKSNTVTTVTKDNMIIDDVKNLTAHIENNLSPTERTIYEVRNGFITIKDKQYPIKLADGYYIIRKLTVTECCRLQTLPDDYCRAVSNAQGYNGLGNGWTAEVIIHILKHMNVPLDEEIVVLSMYDGIGTGRYCFDKMGYKNITYYAYEIDKYPMQVAMSNYPDIIQCGDAFQVREENWELKKPTSAK